MKDKVLKVDRDISGQVGPDDLEVMSLDEFVRDVASPLEPVGFKLSPHMSHVGVIDKDATLGLLQKFVDGKTFKPE